MIKYNEYQYICQVFYLWSEQHLKVDGTILHKTLQPKIKASIISTFNEEIAKNLIGQQIDSSVEKVECEPYEFTNEETGEVIELSHH